MYMSLISPSDNHKRGWITPQEEYDRIHLPLTKKVNQTLALILTKPICAELIIGYAQEPILTHWYKALRKLNLHLRIKIPPLSDFLLKKIRELHPSIPSGSLSNVFSFEKTILKHDALKSPLTKADTHVLTLVPNALKTIRIFKEGFLERYVDVHPSKNHQSYEIDCEGRQCKKYMDDWFEETHWELMSKETLMTCWIEHNSVDEWEKILNENLSTNDYRMPSLQGAITAIFFHRLATGEQLFGTDLSDRNAVFTMVSHKKQANEMIVGDFDEANGIKVRFNEPYLNPRGIAGVIKDKNQDKEEPDIISFV
jgi:hypothetical protein